MDDTQADPPQEQPATQAKERPNLIRELLTLVSSPDGVKTAYERVRSLLHEETAAPSHVAALHDVINHAIRDHLDEAAAKANSVACSFCQLPESQVAWLVQGARAAICDQCATSAELYMARAKQGWFWRIFNRWDLGRDAKVKRGGGSVDRPEQL